MDPSNYEKQLQQIQDSLASVHHRLDRFYSWASQLQVETRNIQQRLKFIESQSKIDLGPQQASHEPNPESNLLARLESIKAHVHECGSSTS